MRSSTTGACVFCGVVRSLEEPHCPRCGRPWIDSRVPVATPLARLGPTSGHVMSVMTATAAAHTASGGGAVMVDGETGYPEIAEREPGPGTDDETLLLGGGEPPVTPLDDSAVRWWLPVGIALLVFAAYAFVFSVLLSRSGREEIAAPVTTTTRGTEPSTSTTTTTATPVTTTLPQTTLPEIPARGDPIPLRELRLGAFQLGPLEFGDPNALGALVATLGQPDTYFPVGESLGLCPIDEGRAMVWGPLTAIFRSEEGNELLVAYRLEGGRGAADHPAGSLRTLSGVGLGDDAAAIEANYEGSRVVFQDIEDRDGFLVLRSTDERTLLWGWLSPDEPATITLVASPRPCDGGPFA